jgi:tRNA-dihydrouridine synthase B
MQDVTDLAFMHVIAHYGAPDYFFTEFFRVHAQSRPETHILRSIDENDTGRPGLRATDRRRPPPPRPHRRGIAAPPVAGIDLNLGCPAPKVYKQERRRRTAPRARSRRRNPRPRSAPPCPDSSPSRCGSASRTRAHFDRLLDLMNEHRVDLLSVHGRTVREMYRSEVRYPMIAHAASRARCPVLANGNVTSAPRAARSSRPRPRAAGVMIGRHAIRNPWIFRQCREQFSGGRPVTALRWPTCASTSNACSSPPGPPAFPSWPTSTR